MKAIQQVVEQFLTQPSNFRLRMEAIACSGISGASFLTLGLDIIAETGKAIIVVDAAGTIVHTALHNPSNGLVIDGTGIQPLTTLQASVSSFIGCPCTVREVSIQELRDVCPPESQFYGRVLSAFDRAAAEIMKPALARPVVAGYQVVDDLGKHWGGRFSFQILGVELALDDMAQARSAESGKDWRMVVVLEGDILNPERISQ